MKPHKHIFEIIGKVYTNNLVAKCEECDYECEHEENSDGFCDSCGVCMPTYDDREDRAYEQWREREL
jgi:hypothetical protein